MIKLILLDEEEISEDNKTDIEEEDNEISENDNFSNDEVFIFSFFFNIIFSLKFRRILVAKFATI